MTDRILILGASGFLGANLALCGSAKHEVVAQARSPLPSSVGIRTVQSELLGTHDSARLLAEVQPSLVINCAALADVDRCERDPKLATDLNTTLPRNLAIACRSLGVGFVHLSTDAVFGAADGPFTPDDPVGPINEYGRSKASGELAVLNELPTAIVARTNIYGWSPTGTRSLLEFFTNALEKQRQVLGFADVYFRPISVLSVWDQLLGWSAEARQTGIGGIRHATGPELVSKFDFGRRVAQAFGLDVGLIQPASVDDGKLTAVRSRCLDVLPSNPATAPQSFAPQFGLDDSLEQLCRAREAGWRDRLSAFASIARSDQRV